jgi:hypothetical protein
MDRITNGRSAQRKMMQGIACLDIERYRYEGIRSCAM